MRSIARGAGSASSKCSYVALTARMYQPVQRLVHLVAMQRDVSEIKSAPAGGET